MTLGEQIQMIRIQKGFTQEALAEKLNVSRQSISKWELGQAIPDVDKIIRISKLFNVSTDTILMQTTAVEQKNENQLHLGSVYLIVKDFEKSLAFYEKFYDVSVSNRCRSGNKFVEFYIENKCISLMNESNLVGHCTSLDGDYKFVQNYWVDDLRLEHQRVKHLNIGNVTDIMEAYPTYHYFHLTDPDHNMIEVTGGYHMFDGICQSCGMDMQANDYGKNFDGSANNEYCKHCYPNGQFGKAATMEEVIDNNLQFLDGFNAEKGMHMDKEEARNEMMKYFPTLKRWRDHQ